MLSSSLSRSRTLIMGFAALAIYFAHAYSIVSLSGLTSSLFALGNLGVDVFFLMSGFGMAFSMAHCGSVRSFYQRRFVRVGIPYLCISVPYYLAADFLLFADSRGTMSRFLLDITSLAYWFFHTGAWYVSALLPVYLLTPLLAKAIGASRHRWSVPIICILVCCLISLVTPVVDDRFMSNVANVVRRLPSFFVGYLVGSYGVHEPVHPSLLSRRGSVCVACLIVGGVVLWAFLGRTSILNFFPALLCAYLLSTVSLPSATRSAMEALGEGSLESYLFNIYCLELISEFTEARGAFVYLVLCVLVIALALAAHRGVGVLSRRLLVSTASSASHS